MFFRCFLAAVVLLSCINHSVVAQTVDHWETIVYNTNIWRYFPGDQAPPADWRSPDFNDSQWAGGPSQ